MFKKLKSQVQEAVNNAAQTLTNTVANNQDNEINTPSVRSRKNSFSSVASDSASTVLFGTYSTPQRKYYPPSDVESEFETSSTTSDWSSEQHLSNQSQSPPNSNSEIKKLNKLLEIYKNKFAQMKNAYAEVESEKEKIKVRLNFSKKFK